MTPKQAAFVAEYLVDKNATQAAIRAGYSKKTAASQGERLLRNVEIRAAIDAAMQERTEQANELVSKKVVSSQVSKISRVTENAIGWYPMRGIQVGIQKTVGCLGDGSQSRVRTQVRRNQGLLLPL